MTDKPAVDIPDESPPGDLVIEDVVVGSGAEATIGLTVAVHYIGLSWSTRTEFDASWNRDDPFCFRVGKGQVIEGWDRGLIGMRVGGRRRLTIPPQLGYGATGAGLFIRPNETLVFLVDLVEVADRLTSLKRRFLRRG